MADAADIVHLMVELGPDKGRRIAVPETGARIGRSSQNDIELTDPSISRFQCRVFFKPDGLLWLADLGSTNESLVNGRPVLECKLNVGDTIEIGESIIRVIADNLKGVVTAPPRPAETPPPLPVSQPSFAPPPAFSPLASDGPPPVPEGTAGKIDLGLVGGREAEPDGTAPAGSARRWLWLVLVLMVAFAAVALMKSNLWKPRADGTTKTVAAENTFEIFYEKVNASPSNIFRYALSLENDRLSVQIDSLAENRHVSRQKTVAKDILDKFRSDVGAAGFFGLDASYQGLQPDAHNLADLEITIGPRSRRSVVLNRIEPDEFKHVREMIEEFAKNELGLITISLSPEKLLELARAACLQGQKLYGEREVKYGNLLESIRAFEEARLYLETIEPKPDFYPTVIEGIEDGAEELGTKCENYQFLARKSIKMQDWSTAAENLRVILELVPDSSMPNDAMKKIVEKYRVPSEKELIDVERRIKRR